MRLSWRRLAVTSARIVPVRLARLATASWSKEELDEVPSAANVEGLETCIVGPRTPWDDSRLDWSERGKTWSTPFRTYWMKFTPVDWLRWTPSVSKECGRATKGARIWSLALPVLDASAIKKLVKHGRYELNQSTDILGNGGTTTTRVCGWAVMYDTRVRMWRLISALAASTSIEWSTAVQASQRKFAKTEVTRIETDGSVSKLESNTARRVQGTTV